MIIGENDTAFASDGSTVAAFDIKTGAHKWTAPGTQLVMATAGGGVAYNNGVSTLQADNLGNKTVISSNNGGNSYFYGDSWKGFSGINAGPSLDAALYSPWSSPPPDRKGGPKITVTIVASKIDELDLGPLPSLIKDAAAFWNEKTKGQLLLQWNNHVADVVACDNRQGCSGANKYNDLEAFFTRGEPELVRRFCKGDASQAQCQPSGDQVLLAATINNSGTVKGWTDFRGTPSTGIQYMNIVVLSAANSDGLAFAHEIGHTFSLRHVAPNLFYLLTGLPGIIPAALKEKYRTNLMCGDDSGFDLTGCFINGGQLTGWQIRDALNGAKKWQDKP